MYRIIGGDGNAYGPVDLETLRLWIGERRLDGNSQVQLEGGAWKPLREFPELAALLSPGAPAAAAGMAAAPAAPAIPAAQEPLYDGDYTLDIGNCIGGAWRLYKANFGLLLGATVVLAAIQGLIGALSSIPLVGLAVQVNGALLSTPLFAGLLLLSVRCARGERVEFPALFDGFRRGFLPMALCGLLNAAIWFACMLPAGAAGADLLLPGLRYNTPPQFSHLTRLLVPLLLGGLVAGFVSLRVMFAPLLILDRGLELKAALGRSWRRTGMHFFSVLGLLIAASVVGTLGIVACFIGVAFTLPISFAAQALAYEAIFRQPRDGRA